MEQQHTSGKLIFKSQIPIEFTNLNHVLPVVLLVAIVLVKLEQVPATLAYVLVNGK